MTSDDSGPDDTKRAIVRSIQAASGDTLWQQVSLALRIEALQIGDVSRLLAVEPDIIEDQIIKLELSSPPRAVDAHSFVIISMRLPGEQVTRADGLPLPTRLAMTKLTTWETPYRNRPIELGLVEWRGPNLLRTLRTDNLPSDLKGELLFLAPSVAAQLFGPPVPTLTDRYEYQWERAEWANRAGLQ